MLQRFITELYFNNIIKFSEKEEFVLKSGKKSNIYFDLRSLISYPKLFKTFCEIFYEKIKEINELNNFPSKTTLVVCGVPYSGIPIATYISQISDIPMIMVRKEKKEYGTKKLIEGNFGHNTIVLLVDDVMTTGSSLQEYSAILEKEEIQKVVSFAFLDRSEDKFACRLDITSVITISEVSNILTNYIFRKNNLSDFINRKKSRLIFSGDVENYELLKEIVKKISHLIIGVKVHSEVIKDYDAFDFYKMSIELDFLIMDDRKFCDIGNIASKQYENIFRCSDIVTVHGIMGETTLLGVKSILEKYNLKDHRKVFLVAQVSSENNLINEHPSYTIGVVELAKKHSDIVAGFITQGKISVEGHNFLSARPGINLDRLSDGMGQTYGACGIDILFPQNSFNDVDIIIVGRGIYESNDVIASAERYRNLLQ